jgi:hypothetical protein
MSQAAALADTSVAAPDNTAADMAPPSRSHIGSLSSDIVKNKLLPLLMGSPKDAFNFLLLSRSFYSAGVSSPVLCHALLTSRWPSLARYLAQNPTQAVLIYRQRIQEIPLDNASDTTAGSESSDGNHVNDREFQLGDYCAFLDARQGKRRLFSGDILNADQWFTGKALRKFHEVKFNRICQFLISISDKFGKSSKRDVEEERERRNPYVFNPDLKSDDDSDYELEYFFDEVCLSSTQLRELEIELFVRRSDGEEIYFDEYHGADLTLNDPEHPVASHDLIWDLDDINMHLLFTTDREERVGSVSLSLRQFDHPRPGTDPSPEPKTEARLRSVVNSMFLKNFQRRFYTHTYY